MDEIRRKEAWDTSLHMTQQSPLSESQATRLARHLYQSGNVKQATDICTDLVRRGSSHPPAYDLLSTIAMELGDYNTVQGVWRRAQKFSVPAPQASSNVGQLLQRTGQHAEAVPHFLQAVKLCPTDSATWYALGRTFMSLKDFPSAISTIDRCLALIDAPREALQAKAISLCALGKHDEARFLVNLD